MTEEDFEGRVDVCPKCNTSMICLGEQPGFSPELVVVDWICRHYNVEPGHGSVRAIEKRKTDENEEADGDE